MVCPIPEGDSMTDSFLVKKTAAQTQFCLGVCNVATKLD